MRFILSVLLTLFISGTAQQVTAQQTAEKPSKSTDTTEPVRLAFVGLHGGIFEILQQYEGDYQLQLDYFTDEQLAGESVDFSPYSIIFFHHVRGQDRDHYRKLISAGQKQNPDLRIISISGLAEKHLPLLTQQRTIENDPDLKSFYGSSPENLRRFLQYVSIKYLKRPGKILPPEKVARLTGLYHPDHQGMFSDTDEFLTWAKTEQKPTSDAPRVVVAVHSTHLAFQQPKVVYALIRNLEQKGAFAVA